MNILEHPIYKNIYDLCQEIEKLPASPQQTKVVMMASDLERPVAQLLAKLRDLDPTKPETNPKMETTNKKIALPLGRIAGGRFMQALNRLGNLPGLAVKDMYALGRTIEQLEPELKRYSKCLEKLIEKHGGTTNLQEATAQLEKARKELEEIKGKETDAVFRRNELNEKVRALEELIVMYERTGNVQWTLKVTAPAFPEFIKERDELEAQRVELFLDHKIKLPEKAGELTSNDVRELLEIIEV